MNSKFLYCTLYIVRHGETDWNRAKRLQGQKKHIGLNSKGRTQVEDLKYKLKNIHFSAIFSSDLARAKETAEIITLERKIAVITKKALRERSFGKFEGKLLKNYKEELKDQIQKLNTLSEKEQHYYRLHPDVETDEEISVRFIRILREISVSFLNKKVLIITHSGIMRAFLWRLGYAYRQIGTIKNTAYIKLDSDDVDFFVREIKGIEINIH